jgi:tetratricopeptide (TPR) repeat protein
MKPRPALLALLVFPLACQQAEKFRDDVNERRRQAAAGSKAPFSGPAAEAKALIDKGDLDAALARLQQAPADPESLYMQAVVWTRKAATAPEPAPPSPLPRGWKPPEFKPEELQALELFEKAVAAQPNHAGAHLGIADLLAPHALRMTAAERAAARKRGVPLAKTSRRAQAEGPDASIDRVIGEYRLAVQADPGKAAAESFVQFCLDAYRIDDADAAFQELMKRDKEKPEPLVRYGDFLVKEKKDRERAITQYELALTWRPDDEATRLKIADLYIAMAAEHFAKREYATAEARLKSAQKYVADKQSPQWARIQEQSGRLAQIRGR